MRKLRGIYLDYAAATPVDPRVLRAMRPYWSERFGNPGSLHRAGSQALAALDRARKTVAELAGVEFRGVVFAASATEANNLALRGVVRAFTLGNQNSFSPAKKLSFPSARHAASRGGQAGAPAGHFRGVNARPFLPKIVVSGIEHDSVLETARDMERVGEVELVVLPVDRRGIVDLKKLEAALDDQTVLVSVMYVNNEIGTVQPIAEIAKIIGNFRNSKLETLNSQQTPNHKSQTPNVSDLGLRASDLAKKYPLFHVDAAQAFLYYPCRMEELGVNLMTLSSQKIYGPKGAGALVINSKQTPNSKSQISNISDLGFRVSDLSQLAAPIVTGGGQEFGLRAGTENVPAIVGFAEAVRLAERERTANVERARKARDTFVRELKKAFPGVEENVSASVPHAPHIANLAFPRGVLAGDLLVLFDRALIAASAGAACSARALMLSHVLQAMGISDERIKRSIRFSFGRGVSGRDAKSAARKIAGIIRRFIEK